ncbi:hypothetical protein QQF64_003965 [Cirrhinus molitorella]|uniref:Uncharacterized protein n=1 Tax=Cirrhinus molitorella TaxID=172907 RepID=A0ABR3MMT4_9TELE
MSSYWLVLRTKALQHSMKNDTSTCSTLTSTTVNSGSEAQAILAQQNESSKTSGKLLSCLNLPVGSSGRAPGAAELCRSAIAVIQSIRAFAACLVPDGYLCALISLSGGYVN